MFLIVRQLLVCFAVVLCSGTSLAIEPPDPRLSVDLPKDIRHWYRNPNGSCVQCSLGMMGVDQNVPAAATLLWDTEYGSRVRGGSGPSRVARYCRERNSRVYNITGRETWDWMKWATRTGRGAAIGAGTNHFQTLFGYDEENGVWYVCNNNTPHRIDSYSESGFRRLHLASGQWIVILDYPAHASRPRYYHWWR